jgi:hypothetical protein
MLINAKKALLAHSPCWRLDINNPNAPVAARRGRQGAITPQKQSGNNSAPPAHAPETHRA